MEFCWLERLPPELGIQIVWFARVKDRDALLEVLGCEIVRRWYRRDLARLHTPTLFRTIRILGRFGATIFPTKLGPYVSLGDKPHDIYPHTSQVNRNHDNPTTIIVDRMCDTWHGAVVFGNNIQWIEAHIGGRRALGTRTYYKNPRPKNSVVVYDFPEFVDDFKGLPLVAISYNRVVIRCNPTGEITHMISTGDFLPIHQRRHISQNSFVGFKGKIKLYVTQGVAYTL